MDARALSPSSINVSWSVPVENGDTVTEYVVNVTKLRSFDPPHLGLGYGQEDSAPASSITLLPDTGSKSSGDKALPNSNLEHADDSYIQAHAISRLNRQQLGASTEVPVDENAEDQVEARMMQVKVRGDLTSVVLVELLPFTMYEISVRAFNIHGRSLPSSRLRTLTLAPGTVRPSPTGAPKLPDLKGCCERNGIDPPT